MPHELILIPLGFVVGMVGATLGVGGGFMLVPILFTILNWPLPSAVATSLFCTMAVSITATHRYLREGLPDIKTGIEMEAAAMFGAIIGATVARSIPVQWIGVLFATVTVLAMARMWMPEQPQSVSSRLSTGVRKLSTAPVFTLVGALGAVLGLGGGIFKVPLLSAVLGLPTRVKK